MKSSDISLGFGLENAGMVALRFPRATAAVLVIILAIAGYGLTHLTFDEKLRQVFRGDTDIYRIYVQATDEFADPENEMLLLVEGRDVGGPDTFSKLEDLQFELQLLDGVETSFSLFSLRRPIDESGRSAALIADAGEGLSKDLARRIRTHPLLGDKLLSADGEALVYYITPTEPKAPLAVFRSLRERIEQTAQRTLAGTGLQVTVSGFPAIRAGIIDHLVRDQKVLNAAGALVGFLLSLVIFRSLAAALMTAVPAVAAGLSVVGLMGAFGINVTVMSNVVPVLVMILGYTDAMHLNASWRQYHRDGMSPRDAEWHAMSAVGPACILTALTTAFAFASLTISDVSIVRHFGWIGAVGSIGGAVMVLAMHALLALALGKFWTTARRETGMPLDWLARPSAVCARFAAKRAWPLSGVGVVLLALFAIMHFSTPPEHSIREHLAAGDPANEALARLDAKFGGIFPVQVVVPLNGLAPTSPQALARIRAVHEAVGKVEKTSTPLSLWSLAEWSGGGETSGAAVGKVLEQLSATAVSRFIGKESGNALVTVSIPEAPTRITRPLVDRIEQAARDAGTGDINATGMAAMTSRESERTIRNLGLSLGFAVLVGLALISAAFRSYRIGIIAFLPNALPILATGSLLYITDRGMQFTSVIALTVAFGIAVDDTIHFINAFRRAGDGKTPLGEQLVRTARIIGPVLASTTLIIVVGLLTTLTSGLPTIALFGQLAIVTLSAALISDLILLPALMAGPARRWFKTEMGKK